MGFCPCKFNCMLVLYSELAKLVHLPIHLIRLSPSAYLPLTLSCSGQAGPVGSF